MVHVLGTWGGNEQDSFLAMVKPFEDKTGIKVSYEGTRDHVGIATLEPGIAALACKGSAWRVPSPAPHPKN